MPRIDLFISSFLKKQVFEYRKETLFVHAIKLYIYLWLASWIAFIAYLKMEDYHSILSPDEFLDGILISIGAGFFIYIGLYIAAYEFWLGIATIAFYSISELVKDIEFLYTILTIAGFVCLLILIGRMFARIKTLHTL